MEAAILTNCKLALTPMDDMRINLTERIIIVFIIINTDLIILYKKQPNNYLEISVRFVFLCKWFRGLNRDTPGGVSVPVSLRIVVLVGWTKVVEVLVWPFTVEMKIEVKFGFLETGITGCILY